MMLLSLWPTLIGLTSLSLFLLVTLGAWYAGMFDADTLGIGPLFALTAYLLLWVCPSFVMLITWLALKG